MIYRPSRLESEMATWPDEMQRIALEEIARIMNEEDYPSTPPELIEMMGNLSETVDKEILIILAQDNPG